MNIFYSKDQNPYLDHKPITDFLDLIDLATRNKIKNLIISKSLSNDENQTLSSFLDKKVKISYYDKKDKKWDVMFEKLKIYIEENKKLPNGYDKKIPGLVRWVKKNRMFYHKNVLEKEKIEKLETLDTWIWSYYNEVWSVNIGRLREYTDINHQLPPFKKNHPDPEMKSLVLWMGNIRTQHKKGKLSQFQIEEIEDIKEWSWNCKTDKWKINFTKLEGFILEHDGFPDKKDQKDLRIAQWIINNRVKYKNNKLNQEKIRQLEKLKDWVWKCRKNWYEIYDDFKTYLEENKRIPNKRDDKHLANWVNINRNNYHNNKLSKERIEKLEKLDLWIWSCRETKWDAHYAELTKFIKKHNKLPSSNDDRKLFTWVSNNKSNIKRGRMPQDRTKTFSKLISTPTCS